MGSGLGGCVGGGVGGCVGGKVGGDVGGCVGGGVGGGVGDGVGGDVGWVGGWVGGLVGGPGPQRHSTQRLHSVVLKLSTQHWAHVLHFNLSALHTKGGFTTSDFVNSQQDGMTNKSNLISISLG